MSETTTGTAPIRLHAEGEEEAQETEGSLDFLDDLDSLELAEDEDPFEDLSEIAELEKAEKEGQWMAWPAVPGAEVKIAHFSACVERKRKLETQYRSKKGKTFDEKLSPAVEEELWRAALYGTVVKDWKGMRYQGSDLPFSERNYRRLIAIRRFRAFVFEQSQASDKFRRHVEEEAGKA